MKGRAAERLLAHGRHAALFALVAGLLLARAPGWAASVLALGCALLALAAGRCRAPGSRSRARWRCSAAVRPGASG